MAMKKQMELFEPVEGAFDEGGLMDEGGSVDPVSGNDVPVGSTKEEVRDDIPAQLSEGEFVLPADVVRYHGLEKIMELRDEAKAGLQKMEAMGQMGNSEEATLPDDVPFSMDDLEMEDDGIADYQVGGYVPPPNVGFQQSQFAGYQPQIGQPVTQPSTVPAYQAPTQQFTPTQTTAAPSFAAFTQPTSVTYYHADGRTIQVPVDASGNPLIPVPAGFSATKPAAAAPTTPSTTPTYQAPTQTGGDEGPSPEQLKQQEEYKQTVNKRMEAAEELGYTKKQNALEAVLPFVVPGSSFLMGNPERGTVLVDGTIADGSGNSFDPISGEKVGGAGGILGNIATSLGLGKKEEISEAASQMGVSPASIEGLKTIKGEESIKDLIESLPKESKAPSPKETKATAMDAAEFADTGVETALVTEKGTAGEVADTALQARIDKAVGPKDELGNTPNTFVKVDDTGNVVVRGEIFTKDAQGKVSRVEGNKVVNEEGEVIRHEFDDGKVEEFVPSKSTVTGRRPVVTKTAAQARQEKEKSDAAAQAAAGARRESFPTRTESFESRDDYQRNVSRYENQGYSPSRAASAARNKTRADDEAKAQTGNSKSTAVTSSSGKAVRSSSGSVVTSTPPDDDGPSDSKIVCTAMNNAYGFGSFRQTIWLKHSKGLDPAYQKGYHRIFKPLIRFAYSDEKWYNIAVRKTLEGIARRRTADIWMQQRGKRHPIGAVERAILEPICYIVGKIK